MGKRFVCYEGSYAVASFDALDQACAYRRSHSYVTRIIDWETGSIY